MSNNSNDGNDTSFWKWYFLGRGARPGITSLFDIWLPLHIFLSIFLTFLIDEKVSDASSKIMLPLSGIFIGLSFAWAANGLTLIQTKEIKILSSYLKGGIREFIYEYQATFLVIFTTLIFWGAAAFGLFEKLIEPEVHTQCYTAVEIMLYFLLSVSIRECWSIVLFTQELLVAKSKIEVDE